MVDKIMYAVLLIGGVLVFAGLSVGTLIMGVVIGVALTFVI